MATTTITSYSDALETQVGSAGTPAPGNLSRSKVICAPFVWTGASENAKSIALVKLPKGARLLSGGIAIVSTIAAGGKLSVGLAATDGTGIIDSAITGFDVAGVAMTTTVADQVACLLAAVVPTTTVIPFCITYALGFCYELQKECWLTTTTSVAAIGTERVNGYIMYAVD